jgi:hypothetical protein
MVAKLSAPKAAPAVAIALPAASPLTLLLTSSHTTQTPRHLTHPPSAFAADTPRASGLLLSPSRRQYIHRQEHDAIILQVGKLAWPATEVSLAGNRGTSSSSSSSSSTHPHPPHLQHHALVTGPPPSSKVSIPHLSLRCPSP